MVKELTGSPLLRAPGAKTANLNAYKRTSTICKHLLAFTSPFIPLLALCSRPDPDHYFFERVGTQAKEVGITSKNESKLPGRA